MARVGVEHVHQQVGPGGPPRVRRQGGRQLPVRRRGRRGRGPRLIGPLSGEGHVLQARKRENLVRVQPRLALRFGQLRVPQGCKHAHEGFLAEVHGPAGLIRLRDAGGQQQVRIIVLRPCAALPGMGHKRRLLRPCSLLFQQRLQRSGHLLRPFPHGHMHKGGHGVERPVLKDRVRDLRKRPLRVRKQEVRFIQRRKPALPHQRDQLPVHAHMEQVGFVAGGDGLDHLPRRERGVGGARYGHAGAGLLKIRVDVVRADVAADGERGQAARLREGHVLHVVRAKGRIAVAHHRKGIVQMAGRVALQRRPARAVPQGQRAVHNGADRVPVTGHALDPLHGPLIQRMDRPALRVHRYETAHVVVHVAGDGQQTALPRAQLRHALQRQALRVARQGIGPVHVRLIHRSLRRHGPQEQPAVLHHRRPVPPLRQVHRRARVVQRTDERAVLPAPELLPAPVQQGRCVPVRVDKRVKADSLRL